MTVLERLPDKILDFDDLNIKEHDDANGEYWQYIARRYSERGLGLLPGLQEAVESDEFAGSVLASIDRGRWIVQCSVCASAVNASVRTPYFICVGCGSSGKWLRVVFPDRRLEIEEILMMRPGFRTSAPNRNWIPGEIVFDLLFENVIHGIDVPLWAVGPGDSSMVPIGDR